MGLPGDFGGETQRRRDVHLVRRLLQCPDEDASKRETGDTHVIVVSSAAVRIFDRAAERRRSASPHRCVE